MAPTALRGKDRGRAPGRGTPGSFDIKRQTDAEVSLAPTAGEAKPSKTQQFQTQVAAEIIARMEAGTAPWQKSWHPGALQGRRAVNGSTGRPYSGQNSLWLMIRGFDRGFTDPRWMTFNQAKKAGASVRKGAKGERILIYKTFERKNDDGTPKLDAKGRPITGAFASTATVFNGEEIDDMPAMPGSHERERTWEDAGAGEALIAASGAHIVHQDQSEAFYVPGSDTVTLPNKEQFDSETGYYSTAFHELSHWTGHPSRLDRGTHDGFGGHEYAREELVAELGSFLIASETGCGYEPQNSASYLQGWAQRRDQTDPQKEVQEALHDAGKAAQYLLKRLEQAPA
ncbi:ArdC family protein [Pseudoclavibacter sp. CFCC 14310]|uniref:ArdC family protein n=1 Tax=Pseudoclavibacter sp. CFCC 14310 TaxID=2615180 RepID=UPI0017881882|nr:zincin-like metallopeptidase domain-containing protein [Pseudoclavibacter sp. CFCC 14310]